MSELQKKLSGVDFIYLGDNANLPYGAKSPSQIAKLSSDCAKTLRFKSADAVVVACNTASSWALDTVRTVMGDIPVFGVVEPGVAAALEALVDISPGTSETPVLVLATRATVKSGAYGRLLREALSQSPLQESLGPLVIEQPCPLLVPMIEEGWFDHPILHQTIQEYVAPYIQSGRSGVALLACTHYPWIHAAFESALPGWKVVNSAQAVASELVRSDLWEKFLKLSSGKDRSHLRTPQVEWIFTDPDAVPAFASRFTGREIVGGPIHE